MRKGKLFSILSATIVLILGGAVSCRGRDDTYNKPESFIVDPETGEYYISNINGNPAEEAANGYIVKLDKDLKVINKKYIKSGDGGVDLHAPKGLAIVGDNIYVADLTSVRGYNKKTRENVLDLSLKNRGAKSLNDITADTDGNIYVSDIMKNIIFKIATKENNAVSVYKQGSDLAGPNGLVFLPESGNILIASREGKVLVLEKDGTVYPYVERQFQALDGIDYDNDGNVYLSDYKAGVIYKISPAKSVTVVKEGLKTPADISVDRKKNLLLVPLLLINRIETIDLKK